MENCLELNFIRFKIEQEGYLIQTLGGITSNSIDLRNNVNSVQSYTRFLICNVGRMHQEYSLEVGFSVLLFIVAKPSP